MSQPPPYPTIDVSILGGATRGKTRPRGFIDNWRPQKHTTLLLEQVEGILREYAAHLPLTIRQIFYRLVGSCGYAKTERAYDNLCETRNKARRARIIDMDDTLDAEKPDGSAPNQVHILHDSPEISTLTGIRDHDGMRIALSFDHGPFWSNELGELYKPAEK